MSSRPSPLKSPPVTENPSNSPPWPVNVNDALRTSSEAGAVTPGPRNTETIPESVPFASAYGLPTA